MPQVAIIGLGVSGLAAAAELARKGVPFVAYEKADRPGGLARSETIDGFRFDYGPHILLGSAAELDELFGGLPGLELAERRARSGVAVDGNLDVVVPVPFQRHLNHLPWPARARLLAGVLRRAGRRPVEPRSYAEYVASRCGSGVYEMFVRGYDTKRLRFDLDRIPADWTKRVEPASLRSLIAPRWLGAERPRESRFRYPQAGGIEAVPRAMARLLPEGAARYGAELAGIDPRSKRLLFASGPPVEYERLIVTAPLPETVRMLRDAPEDVRRAAENLPYTSVFVLGAGIEGAPPPWTLLRLPDGKTRVYRLSFPSDYSAGSAPEGHSLVMAEIGHHQARSPVSPADAMADFRAMLPRFGVRGRMKVEHARNIRYGHVLYNHETRASVEHIVAYLERRQVFVCGRYGAWREMLIPESMRSGRDAARACLQR